MLRRPSLTAFLALCVDLDEVDLPGSPLQLTVAWMNCALSISPTVPPNLMVHTSGYVRDSAIGILAICSIQSCIIGETGHDLNGLAEIMTKTLGNSCQC